MKRWQRSTRLESGAKTQTRTLFTLTVSAFPSATALLSWCWWKKKIFTNLLKFSAAPTYRWRKITSGVSETRDWAHDSWFEWDKSVLRSPSTNDQLLQPCSGDQTLSLWGRPNDFYLLLCKHIKAISDCGGSSVFDHAAAVLAEAWLVSLGSSFCSLCKQKEALRKSSWLIPFASIPLLKAVRRLPGKPNMTAKTKHDSARRRMRHSWGIEQGTTF